MTGNGYKPQLMRVVEAHEETPDVRTLRLEFTNGGPAPDFKWRAGQFAHFSIFGAGECVFTIANPPTRAGYIQCTFRQMGKTTGALRNLSVGQLVGFRGPYGNFFPMEEWRGRDLLFVGGGIGMAALHAPLLYALDHRAEFGEILVLNGARTVADMVYKEEMKDWQKGERVKVVRAVDPGGETPGWDGEVGLIPNVFEKLQPEPNNRIVIVCGPPIMLGFMFGALDKLGFAREQVITTLENKMKCGIGQCGRCNVGRYFVCRDGPVFTGAQLKALPKDY